MHAGRCSSFLFGGYRRRRSSSSIFSRIYICSCTSHRSSGSKVFHSQIQLKANVMSPSANCQNRKIAIRLPTRAKCPPTTGLALNPLTRPLGVSYQSPNGCLFNPFAAYFLTDDMNRSLTSLVEAMAAVQISQSAESQLGLTVASR